MPTPRVAIEYCTQCRWLLRAGWVAQELLTTFAEELGEVALKPGQGGVSRGKLGLTGAGLREARSRRGDCRARADSCSIDRFTHGDRAPNVRGCTPQS